MNTTQQVQPDTPHDEVLTFGRFRLDPVQHVLLEDDKPLRLGDRALEILIVLVERTGRIVSKDELLSRVWPNIVVQDATLRVHICALRKALHEGESGVRYVENFSGRGYRFLPPAIPGPEPAAQRPTPAATPHPPASPCMSTSPCMEAQPAPFTRIIGRTQAIATLAARIPQCRFVTLAGPGGIGKSVVAAAAAEKLAAGYEHGIRFVDCSQVREPSLLAQTLVLALNIPTGPDEEPLHALLYFLHDKSMLLMLDNCDRVIEVAAILAERVLQAAPGVDLLATSREPLRAEYEHVHRLPPLNAPAPTQRLTPEESLSYSAIELFVQRASACLDSFELHESEVSLLAQLCNRLEGNPLAIELAAARVDLFGIEGLAAGLTDSLRLLTRGRRTALPRHQSLRATLEWSYELLAPLEQIVLRRLAVFCNPFDVESASTVAEDGEIRAVHVLEALTNLVAKSLLVREVIDGRILYRLPETTRAYAFEKMQQSDEVAQTLLLHAETWPSCATPGLIADRASQPAWALQPARALQPAAAHPPLFADDPTATEE